MSITSPIADLLTRMRNGLKAQKDAVALSDSKFKRAILDVFIRHGYIHTYQVVPEAAYDKRLVVSLKYVPETKEPAILYMGMVSKPGLRRYATTKKIPHKLNGLGITVVSTSKGVMSDKRARKEGIGGEIVCQIY